MIRAKKNFILQAVLWVLQGLLVGIGAIMPGISGGSLLYAFGIYAQMLEVLANPVKGIKKHWKMLSFVLAGVAIGFVGFAAVVEALLNWNEPVVICAFVGLIIGTLPSLWHEAGERGRNKWSVFSLTVSFIAITAIFIVFEHFWHVTIPHNTFGWILCGLIWGLGFVVPGLSSSNLLMFFGIYNILLGGIKDLNFSVVIPFVLSVLVVFLLLSKVMKLVLDKFHSVMSHCIFGFVSATTIMILPSFNTSWTNIAVYVICIIGGAVASFFFTKFSDKISEGKDELEKSGKTT
ncbi:MAG: DUF368 domain-containing protein [Ruminococcaceae bacterium]|nr:DUF368 domain-containing protein [Oscillospiraceae bacterium]